MATPVSGWVPAHDERVARGGAQPTRGGHVPLRGFVRRHSLFDDLADDDRAGDHPGDDDRADHDPADDDRADHDPADDNLADDRRRGESLRGAGRSAGDQVRYPHFPHHRWARLAQRWVPESLRDSRVDPGRRGALLLTVIAAVAALVAAVGVWRDRPEPRPVQAVSLAQVTDAATSGTRTAAPGTSGKPGRTFQALPRVDGPPASTSGRGAAVDPGAAAVVVSVTGAVRHPGLVRLPAGSRVADAIDKAGGATARADLTGLNLAMKLSDGASVVVGAASAGPAGTGGSVSGPDQVGDQSSGSGGVAAAPVSGRPTTKLDLNTADVAALDALPGVGPVTAASIIAWRQKNGRYTSIQQLQEIQGIGPAKFAALSALVKV